MGSFLLALTKGKSLHFEIPVATSSKEHTHSSPETGTSVKFCAFKVKCSSLAWSSQSDTALAPFLVFFLPSLPCLAPIFWQLLYYRAFAPVAVMAQSVFVCSLLLCSLARSFFLSFLSFLPSFLFTSLFNIYLCLKRLHRLQVTYIH